MDDSHRPVRTTVAATGVGLLLALGLTGCGSTGDSTTRLEANVADGTVVAEGSSVTVSLPGNPTTGYEWICEATDGSLELVGNSYEKDKSDSTAVGVGGTYTFELSTTEAGEGTARFSYERPWESSAEDRSAEVRVEVDEDGAVSRLTVEESEG